MGSDISFSPVARHQPRDCDSTTLGATHNAIDHAQCKQNAHHEMEGFFATPKASAANNTIE
jgi:hypothetical protein